jgi:adenosylcobinamide-phosphate guanylyltransferase
MVIAILMAGGKGRRMESSIEKPLIHFRKKPLIDHVICNLNNSKYINEIIVTLSPNTPKTKKHLINSYITENRDSPNLSDINNNNNSNINSNNNNICNNNSNSSNINSNNNNICNNNSNSNSNNSNNSNICNNNSNSNNNNNDNSNNNVKPLNFLDTSGIDYLTDLSFILGFFEKKSEEKVLLIINADLPFVTSEIIDFVLDSYFRNDKESLSVVVPKSLYEKYGINYSFMMDDLVPSGVNVLVSRNKIQNEEKLVISKLELALNVNTIEDINLANDLFDLIRK